MSDEHDNEPEQPIRRRQREQGPPTCKMCRSVIPDDCPLKRQGYCSCVMQFSRYAATKKVDDKKRGDGAKDNETNGTSASASASTATTTATTKPTSKKTVTEKTSTETSKEPKEPQDASKMKCYKCHFFGHLAKDCTTKICDHCKGRRHTTEQCKKNPNNYCNKCEYFGHTEENCRSKVCEDCGKKGHSSNECWKNATCTRCGKTGHPSDRCKKKCQICNRFGHAESECEKTVKCWICKAENSHTARNCPDQKTMECVDCGETGHHTKFCNNEYMFKNR